MICIIDTYDEDRIRGIFTSLEEAMEGLKNIVSEDLEWHTLPKAEISDCYIIVDVKNNSTTIKWDKDFRIDWDNLFREVLKEDKSEIVEDDLITDPLEIISDVNAWLDRADLGSLRDDEEETIIKLLKEHPVFSIVCTGMYEAGKLGL